MKSLRLTFPLALFLGAAPAHAVTIVTDFSTLGRVYQDAAGVLYSSGGSGRQDATASFERVANYAAAVLDKAVGATWSTTITFASFANIGAVAYTAPLAADSANRITYSNIVVDAAAPLYIDPTPWNNSEFAIQSKSALLGGGEVNVSRFGNAITTEAEGRFDLLTLLTHEMEHAIGYIAGSVRWDGVVTNGQLLVPNTLSGLQGDFNIPVTTDSHIDGIAENGLFNDTTIASPGFWIGQRSLLTSAEILGACSIVGCTSDQVDLNPYASVSPVPLPSAAPLLAMGLVALGTFGTLTKRRDRPAAA